MKTLVTNIKTENDIITTRKTIFTDETVGNYFDINTKILQSYFISEIINLLISPLNNFYFFLFFVNHKVNQTFLEEVF